ncbi:hypothetical protein [Nitrosomonas sp. Nm33]|uniref:hypothetical protein n=1 Tax=Nitrosomonas sp. Nm33 TaxID=133724 RepID=UPI00089596DD|nr:hypothetical protein [Nitrosomonas sp. Nm33]SDZ01856.1 hypothetical protein SAMN05421755_10842 [Nitrosomonas sp. Nm33]
MNIKILILSSLMILLFVTSSLARVLDDNVPLFQVPEKVRQTIKEYTQDGMIENVEKRTMKKKVIVYDAEVRKPNGEAIEITIEEDGTFVEIRHPQKSKSHKLK